MILSEAEARVLEPQCCSPAREDSGVAWWGSDQGTVMTTWDLTTAAGWPSRGGGKKPVLNGQEG